MSDNFSGDSRYQQISEAYALDAVDFARNNFKTNLNWSDSSVSEVEKILGVLHEQLAVAKPTDQQIAQFAKMFGSYIGEVFRKNHGATWGLVTLQGQTFPGLKASGFEVGLFWPWGKSENRIRNGPEDNVWHYYQVLMEKNGTPIRDEALAKKSWWAKLRGA